MYLDYDYYANVYGGDLVDKQSFPRYELKARMILEGFVLKPKSQIEALLESEHADRIKLTLCELIDNSKEEEKLMKVAEEGQLAQFAGISSETTKDHTVRLDTKTNAFDRVKAYIQNKDIEVMYKYLLPTGLLYRGMKVL